MSARAKTSAFETASPPTSATSARARPEPLSDARTGSPHPRASAPAMFPAPMNPTCMRPESLGLVEEALLDERGALLGGDLDVARGEQEHLVGDPLHAPVQRVRQPRHEVDEAHGQVGVRALQVDDHRDRLFELVGDVLGVVERLGYDEMHADLPAAVGGPWCGGPSHAAQLGGPALGRRLVAEDVVDLITAAARRQPADVRTFLVPGRGLTLGLLVVRFVVVVVLTVLSEAEVDKDFAEGVTHGSGVGSRRTTLSLQSYEVYSVVPIRTIVAPSLAATAKSWLVPMLRC